MRTLAPTVAASTCDIVLSHDFPDLTDDRRRVVTSFVVDRLRDLPGPMRWGVLVIATTIDLVRLVSSDRVIVRLSRLSLPLVGEYFRLIRSLSYAYVWETWPDTTPSGSST